MCSAVSAQTSLSLLPIISPQMTWFGYRQGEERLRGRLEGGGGGVEAIDPCLD